MRIERAYSKDKILELYLNEIFLGIGSYGVAAAALNYFSKELKDLEPHEAAYLAALPKAPASGTNSCATCRARACSCTWSTSHRSTRRPIRRRTCERSPPS